MGGAGCETKKCNIRNKIKTAYMVQKHNKYSGRAEIQTPIFISRVMYSINMLSLGTFWVQWLRLQGPSARPRGFIPGPRRSLIPVWCDQINKLIFKNLDICLGRKGAKKGGIKQRDWEFGEKNLAIALFVGFLPHGKHSTRPLMLYFTLLVTIIWVSEWVKVAQSCPILCDPMDYRVHGIL